MQFRRIFGLKSDGKERAIGSTDAGRLKVEADISGGLDTAGLATQTTLAAILAKIIAAPSTAAKQDLIITALGLIATEATTGDIKTATDALAAKQAATTITEYNITLTLADTEYSQALPANTKKIEFWSRGKYQFRHAFTTGKVAGLVQPYFTAFANSCYESPGMADLTSKIIYFATDSAGDVIEMRVWS